MLKYKDIDEAELLEKLKKKITKTSVNGVDIEKERIDLYESKKIIYFKKIFIFI